MGHGPIFNGYFSGYFKVLSMSFIREEALRSLKATKDTKEKRIAVLKRRICKIYNGRTGVEPHNVVFL